MRLYTLNLTLPCTLAERFLQRDIRFRQLDGLIIQLDLLQIQCTESFRTLAERLLQCDICFRQLDGVVI
jgi:hypothetical protein